MSALVDEQRLEAAVAEPRAFSEEVYRFAEILAG